jgi:hypothetical protein
MSLRVSTPDEEMSGSWVADDTEFVGGDLAPPEIRLSIPNEYQEIPGTFRMKTGLEVFMGCGIASPAGNQEYSSEHFD